MAKEPTAVAEPQAAAPSPEPEAQAQVQPVPESPPEQPLESESGTGDAAFRERLLRVVAEGGPEMLDAIHASIPEDVRQQTALFKDARRRGTSSGRQDTLNEWRVQQRDLERHEEAKQSLADAEKALSADDLDGPGIKRNAATLREKAQDVRTQELKQEALSIFRASPGFSDYGETEIERLERVSGVGFDRWLREHVAVMGDARENVGYERGKAEGSRQQKGLSKLEEGVAAAQAAAEGREGAPPRPGPGAPLAGSGADNAKLLDPNTPIAELMAIRTRQKGGA